MSKRFRIACSVLTGVLATVGGLVVARPADAAVYPVVTMSNHGSGLCATAQGTYDGAAVVQSACTYPSSPAQLWARVSLGNGYELLQSVASTSTYPYVPRCLDVTDGINRNGTPLQVWRCTNTPGMNWRLVTANVPGYGTRYKLQTQIGGRCLDVPGGSLVDGVQLQIWTCSAGSGNAAQLWRVPTFYHQ